ncbi:Flp pilus assembly protein TadG [Gemmobacter megaterium]|uniref:Flp pilus assembly protein TadG n=2 Tax=Gemmobacter megaterium TaxID=1086013 RepID=A0A1N7K3S4_9RHOB|nr:Flp pilus assembly protein TadG [Gemmobacter megaterium]
MVQGSLIQPPRRAIGSGRSCLLSRAARFRRDEDGSMLFFSMVVLLIMLFVGGMAIDMMRYEAERSRTQATADAAVLAAAAMRQTRPPAQVVQDWFDKADLSDSLTGVIVDNGLNFRTVRAQTRTVTRPYFMQMLGVDELRSNAASTAEERRTNVEIVLVLDISGSMQGTKLTRLKDAAVEFVTNILEEDTENRVSISIVPYNGQVNVGPDLRDRFNVLGTHNRSYCIDLPHSSYQQLALPTSTPMYQHAFADTYNTSNTSTSWSTSNMTPGTTNVWCPVNSTNRVRVHSNNLTLLTSQIRNLEAVGATSIDAGLRWGVTLIDPGSRPLITSLANGGIVPNTFRNRPFDYDDEEVLKVIVLMTDGEHWPNEFVNDDFKSGDSPIYRHSDGYYSIHHPGRSGSNKYWVPHRSEWRAVPWSGSTWCSAWSCVATATRNPLPWQTVWVNLRVQWVANQLYRRALGGSVNSWVEHLRTREGTVIGAGPHEVSRMDTRINTLCTLVKQQNVAIFGIAFEAPTNGQNLIRNCASPGRFYDVNGLDISTAFRAIRAQISALRLTQ